MLPLHITVDSAYVPMNRVVRVIHLLNQSEHMSKFVQHDSTELIISTVQSAEIDRWLIRSRLQRVGSNKGPVPWFSERDANIRRARIIDELKL